jgi:hypothetical protein
VVDWTKIKTEYVAGGTSYRKLCAKYGVSRTTLQRKAKDENWLGLRSQAEAKTETKIVKAISEKKANIDDKYFKLVDMLFDKAEEVIVNTPVWNANALKEMSTAMKNLKECKGVKSEADIREQEARIAKLQKEAQEDTPEDREVNVIFDGDIEQYSK